MTDVATAICRVPGCGGPASGVCLNGLEFDECPDVVEPEDGAAAATDDAVPDVVATRGGSTLTAADADLFLRTKGGIVVATVAGPNAGKTTMAATIYELAHRGRLDGISFAGSETIAGFEERCFLSRIACNGDTPDTARTPTSAELAFLHLDLVIDDGRRADLLISDRSGEHFDDALDRPAMLNDFVELARADAILLLLDAERLANNHHTEIARVRKLILGLSHAGLLARRTVHLVLTKNDKIVDEVQRGLVDRRAAEVVAEFGRRAPDAEVQLHLTACRATAGSSAIGQGVRDLVAQLLPRALTVGFKTRVFTPPKRL